ncbi:MAG: tyrosine recombinase [Planctomycetes bacterium]|nr:tyrosine recombinase [Planctomycetota bacterium]
MPRTLHDHLADFLVFLGAELQLSRDTVAAYRRDLERFLADVGDAEPNPDAIRQHLRALRATHAEASVARAMAAIRGLCRFLCAEGVRRVDPAQGLLGARLEQRLPKALGRGEVERLLDAVDPTHPLALRDRALLEALYATGCRVSELIGLEVGGPLRDHGVLRVVGKGGKERIVPVSERGCAAIERYERELRPLLHARATRTTDRLFLSHTGRPLDRSRIWQIVRATATRAGLHVACSPHALRHSYATHLVMGGADLRAVQELLGHASLATTQVYTKVDRDRLKDVHRRFHPRGGDA